MYIFKNAWTNITRNKTRNILIGVIIIVIGIASTVTLAIKNTATNLIKSYNNAYEAEATIGFSRENMKGDREFNKESMDSMKEEMSKISSISLDEVKDYGDSDYVKSFYYTYSIGINGNNDLEAASSNFSFGEKGNRNDDKAPTIEKADFTLTGYSDIDSITDFINGNYTLTDSTNDIWDKIFDGNYVIINKELADLNVLDLNDKITLVDTSDTNKTYQFTIVGIYEENSESEEISMFSNSVNNIITNVAAVDKIVKDTSVTATVKPTFILTSYEIQEDFQKELYKKGLNENYTVKTNEEEVLSATKSISNVTGFVTTFLIITLLIGIVVLFVINQINIRERKYEIGVLRTIGMKKILLTLQFVIELLIVTIISLMIGLGIGASISKPVGNKLLESEINSSKEQMNDINSNFGGNRGPDMNNIRGVVNVEAYDSINAVVDLKVILELLGIGVVLTLISSISSMISIERFSPLQILKERS